MFYSSSYLVAVWSVAPKLSDVFNVGALCFVIGSRLFIYHVIGFSDLVDLWVN